MLSSLADDEAVLATYLGEDGAASACRPGPRRPRDEHDRAGDRSAGRRSRGGTGAAFLDAPVSGSVPTVEKGELTIMVGGDAAALERARPVLDALAAKVFHVGALGAGATVKLAVNALVHAIDVGLSEALVLAEKAGVDRSAAYDVFAAGAAAAPFVLYKRPAFEDPDNAQLTFTLDLMAKDLDLILSLAREVGAPWGRPSATASWSSGDRRRVLRARHQRDRRVPPPILLRDPMSRPTPDPLEDRARSRRWKPLPERPPRTNSHGPPRCHPMPPQRSFRPFLRRRRSRSIEPRCLRGRRRA